MNLDAIAKLPFVQRAHLARPGYELRGVHCDSRRVDAETAFLALTGFREDGHRFVPDALAAGTPAVFVSDAAVFERVVAEAPEHLAGAFLVVPGRATLADLAGAVYAHPARDLSLLGVTGTSGKSTVTHLVGQLLAALGRPAGLLGTQGLRIGDQALPSARTTPEAPDVQAFLAECRARAVRTAVMEVTSIGIELERTRGLPFAAAAFLNLSQDHLDFHADMAAYREAKFRLFLEYELGCAVINTDDEAGRALVARIRAERPDLPRVDFAWEGPAALTLEGLREANGALEGVLRHEGARAPFRFGLPGHFNRSNLLAAVGLLLATGTPLAELAAVVERCTGAPGRFERVPVRAPFTVIVDYAHKPAALEHVLNTARELGNGRLHVLFGCGGGRDRDKRPQMGAIAARLADRVVLSNDNPRSEDPEAILDQIAAGMSPATPDGRIADRAEAIGALLDGAAPGDIVVIAGKGDETYQEFDGRTVPFDDREVALQWAQARRGAVR